MSAVYPTVPKLAVRDSIDEDDLTDIDDEVFIRDGRNGGLKMDDDGGVKRPLMAPRRKYKKSCSFQSHKFPYKALLIPLCYGIIALIIVLGLIILCIFTANIFPMPLTILKNWLSHELKDSINKSEIISCTSLVPTVVWTKSLPKLTSEAPLRSNDVNLDGIEDIIVGFSTGLDAIDAPDYICTIYFGNQTPCLGGVLALNGRTGETIWTHWTAHAIFSIDCGIDLTNDEIKDCIISGRGGILQAINGQDGSSVWEIPIQNPATSSEQQRILDVYDARFMADMDGDGIGDVIASHAMQSNDIRASNVLIISGKSGSIIRSVNLPNSEQLFVAPQILVHPDGEIVFVLVTSSQKQAGGLYIMSQASMFYGDLQLHKLYHNTGKGALLPPILIDITSDGVEDIVAAMFNSTVMAYNGLTFEPIWNYTIPNSEVISIPIPGYYNDDNVPDFMVKHQIGPGYPTYYYTVAMVIDGRNGQPLLEKPIEDSLSRQMSGLSVTVDGYGNDWFLHWSADCLNHEGAKEKYQFLKGQSLASQTRADLCKLRFNSTLIMKLLALSQHVGPPGILLHFSEDWKSLEFKNWIDPREEAEKFLDSHPQLEIIDTYANVPFVSERSPNIHKNHRKESIFKHKDNNLLAEISKYDSDAMYDNFDEFKDHGENNPVKGAVKNFDMDRDWKYNNKWTRNNVQLNEGLYEGDDENNDENEEQSIDYSQSKMRKQRSVTSRVNYKNLVNISRKGHNFGKIDDHSILVRSTQQKEGLDTSIENIHVKKEKSVEIGSEGKKIDKIDMANTTDTIVQFHEISPIMPNFESKRSSIEDITTTPSTSDTSIFTSERNGVKGTNFNFEVAHMTTPDAENKKFASHRDTSRHTTGIGKKVDMMQRIQIYKHSFPNIVQDVDNDASIEKVFKRESLKNQNKSNDGRKQSQTSSSIAAKNYRIRQKRKTKRTSENQPDEIGIQRQPPTGILLPSIDQPEGKTSVDLIFTTFWLPSSEISLILSQADLECIHRKQALSENKFQYKKDDDIVNECLLERGINYRLHQESMSRENTKIALGQMTIYRMKLECVCPEDMLHNQICKNISLYQSWPGHLGSSGNGYFKPLRKLNI